MTCVMFRSDFKIKVDILPSAMSGALPLLDAPPVHSDLAVKDAADRRSSNLSTKKKT